ncbi:T9SS type A sorting domain-containing protein [Hymenobacter rubidus]|uniref:T9SS type A sorting domain-containing protein n=1 Tax=Hymenobacter rubidus TaxID=1441626 RepID=UPI00192018C3|nr:T9SS type A sorting domain-containing protein [Hymenobacter rubidus]
MKNYGLLGRFALGLLGVFLGAEATAAPRNTPGNVVVVRVGDGTAALTSAAAPVFLAEYTLSGTLVQTIARPTVDAGTNQSFTNSGTATFDNNMTRSADGRYLILTGYDAAVGTVPVTGTTSAATNRIIGRVAADGTIDTSTRIDDAFSATNFRSAASVNGIQKWSLVDGTWTLNGTIGGSATAPLRGLAGSTSGTVVSLVASGEGGLYAVTDNAGYNAAPTNSNLPAPFATPATNTAFRGVALAPLASALAHADEKVAAQAAIYPNPAAQQLPIQLPAEMQTGRVQLQLFNGLGQLVYRQSASVATGSSTVALDVETLANGVYTLRLHLGPTTIAKRIIVSH